MSMRALSSAAGSGSGRCLAPVACLMTFGGWSGVALAAGVGIIRLLARNVRTLHKAVLAVARQDAADVLALTGITAVGGYQVAEGLALPSMELQLMPTHTTADFPPSIVTGRSFGRFGNRVAGMATTTALSVMAGAAREVRHELGLPRRGVRE